MSSHGVITVSYAALDVLCTQLMRDLFVIAKFLFVYCFALLSLRKS